MTEEAIGILHTLKGEKSFLEEIFRWLIYREK